ncbi:hypothetical protein BK654_17940 [Pseudomonas brassicacearum]|nr:hypothetical protein BK654_17940 [Pseudomonas brassicacearum]
MLGSFNAQFMTPLMKAVLKTVRQLGYVPVHRRAVLVQPGYGGADREALKKDILHHSAIGT